MNEEIDEDGVIVKGAKKIGKAVKGVFEKEPEKPKPFNVRLREKIKNIIGGDDESKPKPKVAEKEELKTGPGVGRDVDELMKKHPFASRAGVGVGAGLAGAGLATAAGAAAKKELAKRKKK